MGTFPDGKVIETAFLEDKLFRDIGSLWCRFTSSIETFPTDDNSLMFRKIFSTIRDTVGLSAVFVRIDGKSITIKHDKESLTMTSDMIDSYTYSCMFLKRQRQVKIVGKLYLLFLINMNIPS